MRKGIWALLLGFSLLIIGAVASAGASAEIPPIIPAKVLDNFDGVNDPISAWWDSDSTIVYQRLISKESYHSGHRSMKIEYSKPSGYEWSFFAFQLKQDGAANNFFMYTDLVFWIYTKQPFTLLVKIEDINGKTWEEWLTISEINQWQKVTSNVVGKAGRGGVNPREIRNVFFFIEPGKTNVKGTFYLDDLFLVSRDLFVLASLPSKLETPVIKDLKEIEPGVYRLTWTDLSPQGVTLYEVLEDQSELFTNPWQYWTNNSHLDLTEIPIGTRYYKVRAWTHLPREWGYWGESSPWSEISLLAIEPKKLAKVMDNFDEVEVSRAIDTWWDSDGIDVYYRRVVEDKYHTGGHSMRINYRKTPGYEWSFFAFKPQQNDKDNDFSDYHQLIFWIYPHQETTILLKLEDDDGNTWEEKQASSHTGEWQKFVYHISNAKGQVDLTHIRNVLFFVQPGQSDVAGIFYLDDLFLVSTETFPGTPNTPQMIKIMRQGPDTFKLSWSDETASGAILYEVLKDLNASFSNPTAYWTNNNYLILSEVLAGKYFYKVRSWTHLPEYNGRSSSWSKHVSQVLEDLPPSIEKVDSFAAGDTDNIYVVGSVIRIATVERQHFADIKSASIEIVSNSRNYQSGIKEMVPSEDGSYYYYMWDTSGLQPAFDYRVFITLEDKGGEKATDSSLVIKLTAGLPSIITQLVTEVDVPIPRGSLLMPVTRTYTTLLHNRRGILGYGWTHSYNIFLRKYSNGSVQIFWGDGSEDLYLKDAEGAYYNVRPGDYKTLEKIRNEEFQLRTKYGLVYKFDVDGKLLSILDPNGRGIKFHYSRTGFLEAIEDTQKHKISFEYFQNRLVAVINPIGRKTKYYYDNNGNLVRVTDVLGNETKYVYDERHRLVESSKPNGRHTYFEYDTSGRILSRFNNDGANRIEYQYDETNSSIKIVDALNHEMTYFFNNLGRIARILDSAGSNWQYDWDKNGNLISITDPKSNRYSLTYDERGNVLSLTDPLGNTTYFTYDPFYNKFTSVTDAEGNTVTFRYDHLGNLIAAIDALGNISQYEYDGQGNLIRIRDALNRVIEYLYDGRNQLKMIIYPDDSTAEYTFDEIGNIVSRTKRNGQIIKYIYDWLNRLTKITYPDGSQVTFSYDSLGNVVLTRDDNTGMTLYIYDKIGRLLQILLPDGKSINYKYDQMGNLVALTYPNGETLLYEYDNLNRLVRITVPSSDQIFEYTYDSSGRRARLDFPNGNYTIYNYDTAGRLVLLTTRNASDEVLSNYFYQYDQVVNRVSTITPEGKQSFIYDPAYQLTQVTYPDGRDIAYHYDPLGNRTLVDDNGERAEYIINKLNQYIQVDGARYEYDSNGNLIRRVDSEGMTLYSYDDEDRLDGISYPDGTTIEYKYDSFGRRIEKSVNGQITRYIYEGNRVIMETDNSGKVLATYIWGIGLDELLAFKRANIWYYCHLDGQGSVVSITDTHGRVLESYYYDPYGQPTILDDNRDISDRTLVGNPYLFTGRRFDVMSNLYFYRARYYDPKLGRFLSPDHAASLYDVNYYIYVFNNPINFNDPLGLHESYESLPPEPSTTLDNPIIPMDSQVQAAFSNFVVEVLVRKLPVPSNLRYFPLINANEMITLPSCNQHTHREISPMIPHSFGLSD